MQMRASGTLVVLFLLFILFDSNVSVQSYYLLSYYYCSEACLLSGERQERPVGKASGEEAGRNTG